jgi:hypothetical protein
LQTGCDPNTVSDIQVKTSQKMEILTFSNSARECYSPATPARWGYSHWRPPAP